MLVYYKSLHVLLIQKKLRLKEIMVTRWRCFFIFIKLFRDSMHNNSRISSDFRRFSVCQFYLRRCILCWCFEPRCWEGGVSGEEELKYYFSERKFLFTASQQTASHVGEWYKLLMALRAFAAIFVRNLSCSSFHHQCTPINKDFFSKKDKLLFVGLTFKCGRKLGESNELENFSLHVGNQRKLNLF